MLKKSLVLGSGFGLYGYLPALLKLKKKVYLPRKYKNFLSKRVDLKKYISNVNFLKNANLNLFDEIIFARRPEDQYNFIRHLKCRPFLFLEKPLAENSFKSKKLIQILKKKKLKFSVGYLFFFTSWFKKISKLNKNCKVDIIWNYKSITFKRNSWKNNYKKGGGIISFYGIHFIALFSFLKLKCYSSSIGIIKEKEKNWYAVFKKGKINFNLKLNINAKNEFLIKLNNKMIYKAISPFKKKSIKNQVEDSRVNFLELYIKNKNFLTLKDHSKILNLWEHVVSISKYIHIK